MGDVSLLLFFVSHITNNFSKSLSKLLRSLEIVDYRDFTLYNLVTSEM